MQVSPIGEAGGSVPVADACWHGSKRRHVGPSSLHAMHMHAPTTEPSHRQQTSLMQNLNSVTNISGARTHATVSATAGQNLFSGKLEKMPTPPLMLIVEEAIFAEAGMRCNYVHVKIGTAGVGA